MPETPDFDRLADVCLARVHEVRNKGLIAEHSVVVEQLRQIWNARGAADIAKLSLLNGVSGPSVKVLDQALRSLDR
jgi:hypothetical protein